MNEENMGENVEAATPASNEVHESPMGQATEVQSDDGQMVPVAALQAERTQRQEMAEKLQAIENHLALMNSNQQQQQEPQSQEENLQDDDVLTVGEAKKFIQRLDSKYQMSIQEMKMQQKFPDYQQVVTQFLPDVIKQNPSIADSLKKTQDFELAYHLAKNSDGYRKSNKSQKKNADAEAIMANARATGSLSSVGRTSPVSQAKQYKQMSDSDFSALANRNLGHF